MFPTPAIAALLLAVCGAAVSAAAAATGDRDPFTLRLDRLAIEDLVTEVDQESAKFNEYRDTSSGLRLPELRLLGSNPKTGRSFELRLLNSAREDARYLLVYDVAGSYRVTVDYNKIPHNFANDARFLWTRTGPGRFEIPDPIQQSLQQRVATQFAANRNGVNFAFLDGLVSPLVETSSELDVGLRRDRLAAHVELGKGGAFEWAADYQHENREGIRPYGASFGFNNVTEMTEPIDYDTTSATLRGQWARPRGALAFGYQHSRFENNISTMIWDNPFRATASTDPNAYQAPSSSSIGGSVLGFSDLAPDNDAGQLFLRGRVKLGEDWWLQGSASHIEMRQDDPLLPYTLNSAIRGIGSDGRAFDPTDPATLPVANADQRVDVRAWNLDLGGRFAEDWRLKLEYRFYDYDNRSPRVAFPGYVRYHSMWEEIPRVTVPYAYTREDWGAELDWDLTGTTTLELSYQQKGWERDFREVEDSDEDVLRLALQTRPTKRITLRASAERGDRAIDEYLVEAQLASFLEEEEVNNLADLRKFAQAAREYDQYEVKLLLLPSDAWTLDLHASHREDDYDQSRFGLISDQLLEFGAELSYARGEHSSLYVFGTFGERESFQRARQSGATPSLRPIDDWSVLLVEDNQTWGAGWSGAPAARFDLEVCAGYSESDGEADFAATPGGLPLAGRPVPVAVDFDNYEDIELLYGKLTLDYTVTPAVTVGIWYRYEDYSISSFILQGLRNYLPGALLLAGNAGDYTAHLYAARLEVRF